MLRERAPVGAPVPPGPRRRTGSRIAGARAPLAAGGLLLLMGCAGVETSEDESASDALAERAPADLLDTAVEVTFRWRIPLTSAIVPAAEANTCRSAAFVLDFALENAIDRHFGQVERWVEEDLRHPANRAPGAACERERHVQVFVRAADAPAPGVEDIAARTPSPFRSNIHDESNYGPLEATFEVGAAVRTLRRPRYDAFVEDGLYHAVVSVSEDFSPPYAPPPTTEFEKASERLRSLGYEQRSVTFADVARKDGSKILDGAFLSDTVRTFHKATAGGELRVDLFSKRYFKYPDWLGEADSADERQARLLAKLRPFADSVAHADFVGVLKPDGDGSQAVLEAAYARDHAALAPYFGSSAWRQSPHQVWIGVGAPTEWVDDTRAPHGDVDAIRIAGEASFIPRPENSRPAFELAVQLAENVGEDPAKRASWNELLVDWNRRGSVRLSGGLLSHGSTPGSPR